VTCSSLAHFPDTVDSTLVLCLLTSSFILFVLYYYDYLIRTFILSGLIGVRI
jgi:hypothetical protein